MFNNIDPNYLVYNFLIFCRIAALIATVPGFAESYLFDRAKLTFSIVISLILTPILKNYLPNINSDELALIAYYICTEIMIGAFMGLTIRLTIQFFQVAGAIISMLSGLSAATAFDPGQNSQGAIIGQFYIMVMLLLIFMNDLHYSYLYALIDSYNIFNPQDNYNIGEFTNSYITSVNKSFYMALKLSAPFIVVSLCSNLGAGILSKLMPNFQVFFVLMPIQIFLVISVMYITLSYVVKFFLEYFQDVMSFFEYT